MLIFYCLNSIFDIKLPSLLFAQLAGAVEYTYCFSAEG